MVNMFVSIGEARFKQPLGAALCNIRTFCHSPRLHRPYPAQIERQTDEFEFGFCLFQLPHAELAKSQSVLDPAIGIPELDQCLLSRPSANTNSVSGCVRGNSAITASLR